MDRYKTYRILASFFVAFFIINFAVLILSRCDFIHERSYEAYYNRQIQRTTEAEKREGILLSPFEAGLNYEKISKQFNAFFGNDFSFQGYDISKDNVTALREIKTYYRWAYFFSIISFVGMIYCFAFLHKRRQYMPLLYGGALATFFTVINFVRICFARDGVLLGIKNMIFYKRYDFFGDGDIMRSLFSPEFAMCLGIGYLVIVASLILLFAIIKAVIIYCGRPHRF